MLSIKRVIQSEKKIVVGRKISIQSQNLAHFFQEREKIVCITGAGISTDSGIPGDAQIVSNIYIALMLS
jgi:hypothetical protein